MQPWFVKTYRALVIEVGGLIVLGGSVRVMNAGLACPDWPLCFGEFDSRIFTRKFILNSFTGWWPWHRLGW